MADPAKTSPPVPATIPPAVERATPTPVPFAADTYVAVALRDAKPGSVVSFGTWQQNRNGEKTPLQWAVTEVSGSGGDKVLTLLAIRMVTSDPYHGKYARTTWKNCQLRQWLNGDFMYAFTREEKERLVPYATGAGLEDMVWIPSPSEWAQIDSGILNTLQGYTERGAYFAELSKNFVNGYWLRGGEEKSSKAPYAPGEGKNPSETEVDCRCGVRPMIRVAVSE